MTKLRPLVTRMEPRMDKCCQKGSTGRPNWGRRDENFTVYSSTTTQATEMEPRRTKKKPKKTKNTHRIQKKKNKSSKKKLVILKIDHKSNPNVPRWSNEIPKWSFSVLEYFSRGSK